MLKALKQDNKNWNRKTQYFVIQLKKTSWKLQPDCTLRGKSISGKHVVKSSAWVIDIGALISPIFTVTVLFETISLMNFPILRRIFHFDKSTC